MVEHFLQLWTTVPMWLSYTLFSVLLLGTFAVASFIYRRFNPQLEKNAILRGLLVTTFITAAGVYPYSQGVNRELEKFREKLLAYAPTYAGLLEVMGHEKARVETAATDPKFEEILSKMEALIQQNTSIASVYTFRKNSKGQLYFVMGPATDYNRNGLIDEEREARVDPGEIYESPTPSMELAFQGQTVVDKEITHDRWGSWISSYAPVRNGKGQVEAILGVDFPARDYHLALAGTRLSTKSYVFLTSLLAYIVLLFLGVFQTKNRSAQKERDQLRQLLIEMPVGALLNSGNSITLNRKAAEIFQLETQRSYSVEDFISRVGGLSHAALQNGLLSQDSAESPSQVSLTLHRADGRARDIRLTPSLIGSAQILILEDLTEDNENKRLEEEAQLKLAESAKLATLGEMAGGIAHEINNPLAILNGSADILNRLAQAAPVDTDKITKQVDMIRRTIQRISKIVAGLRVFARDGTNDPFEKISARELIDETLALCQSKLRNHGIRIEIPVIRDDLLFEGQRVQISQVLLNLINNAADAIQKQDRPWIRIDVEDLAFVLKIKVIDSGTGIAPEVASKIMQPFFTTKEVGKGTGLGLSISQSIIKGHQGQLTLDTTAPNTTFVIEIPRKASGGISQPQAA